MSTKPVQDNTAIGRKDFLVNSAKFGAAMAGVAAGLGELPAAARAARVEVVRDAASAANLTWAVEFTDTPDQNTVNQYIIKPYEQANPSVSIKLQAPGGSSNIDEMLRTQFAAGAGPDLFDENGPSWMPPYIKNGYALDLTPYDQKYGWTKKISPFVLQSSLYQGKLYFLPAEYESLHLWVNMTALKKYGWSIPKTYDEMLSVSKEIKAAGLIPFAVGASDCPYCFPEWWFSYLLNAYLGAKKLYRVLTGAVPWTDPDLATAFAMMKNLWDLDYIMNKQVTAITLSESWAVWGQGKAVFRIEGTWGFSPGLVYDNAKSIEWDVAPLPVWKPSLTDFYPPVGVGEVVGISAHSKNPAVAADFFDAAFFRSKQQILKWLPKMSSIFLPALSWQSSDFGGSFDPRLAKVILSLNKSLSTSKAGYLDWTAWPPKTAVYMWSNFDAVLLGKMKIADYLSGTNKTFQSEKAAGALPVVPKPAGL